MSVPPFPSTPYGEVSYDFLESNLLTVIRHDGVTIGDLRRLFDASFQALGGALGAGLFVAVGPAVAIYYGDPQGTFDLEIGYPSAPAPTRAIESAAGSIHASALPAGRAALLSHIGSYDGIGDTWAKLAGGADGKPRSIWIEVYVSDPSTTADDALRTDLVMPLGS